MTQLAPIVLFTYNRPWHTKQTIEALLKNELAGESELFIYSDAPKNKEAEEKVKQVRGYIKSIDGFKKKFYRTSKYGKSEGDYYIGIG